MGRFDGQVAIVTGAARGIGAAIARRLASEGARVGVFDLNLDGAETVVQEIRSAGGEGLALACDVSNAEQVEASIKKVVEQYGKLDILVNNAGVIRDNLPILVSRTHGPVKDVFLLPMQYPAHFKPWNIF